MAAQPLGIVHRQRHLAAQTLGELSLAPEGYEALLIYIHPIGVQHVDHVRELLI